MVLTNVWKIYAGIYLIIFFNCNWFFFYIIFLWKSVVERFSDVYSIILRYILKLYNVIWMDFGYDGYFKILELPVYFNTTVCGLRPRFRHITKCLQWFRTQWFEKWPQFVDRKSNGFKGTVTELLVIS